MIDTLLLAPLSDDELLTEAKRLVANERVATAALLTSLMEIDARRLYLREGCSSLFTYCTQVLHLAEGAAYNRIEAARVAHRFPVVLEALRDGAVTLTSIRLLAPHFSDGNHPRAPRGGAPPEQARGGTANRDTRPKPAVPTVIRKLPSLPAAGDGLLEDEPPMSPPEISPTARALVPERVEARPAGTSVLDRPSVRASIEPERVGAAEPL